MSNIKLREAIYKCDTEVLIPNILESLCKICPTADELTALSKDKHEMKML